jgi:hypothetical protein
MADMFEGRVKIEHPIAHNFDGHEKPDPIELEQVDQLMPEISTDIRSPVLNLADQAWPSARRHGHLFVRHSVAPPGFFQHHTILLEASESAFFVPTFVHGVCDPLVIEETPSADALFWHSETAAKTEICAVDLTNVGSQATLLTNRPFELSSFNDLD